MDQLVKVGVLEKVKCVSPLSVAINRKGKKRLCFDLSRSVNKFYHQISIHPDYRGYLGLAVEREDGHKDFYVFKQLPFGLNDAARVVTKLLRGPLE